MYMYKTFSLDMMFLQGLLLRTRQTRNSVPTLSAGRGGRALSSETGTLWVSGFGTLCSNLLVMSAQRPQLAPFNTCDPPSEYGTSCSSEGATSVTPQ